MSKMLQLEKIRFSNDRGAICIFPNDIDELEQGLRMMGIQSRPVIVLIGGNILPEHDAVHESAVEVIARAAEDLGAVMICGGTDMGIMALIGQIRWRLKYRFPLIGIAPEELVTWPGGPLDGQPALPDGKRFQLEPHHSHFVLVPGSEFGDESPWIVRAALFIAGERNKAVTILANGGKVSEKDIGLALDAGEPVIVLKGTGRYADELASQPKKDRLFRVVQADNRRMLSGAILSALS